MVQLVGCFRFGSFWMPFTLSGKKANTFSFYAAHTHAFYYRLPGIWFILTPVCTRSLRFTHTRIAHTARTAAASYPTRGWIGLLPHAAPRYRTPFRHCYHTRRFVAALATFFHPGPLHTHNTLLPTTLPTCRTACCGPGCILRTHTFVTFCYGLRSVYVWVAHARIWFWLLPALPGYIYTHTHVTTTHIHTVRTCCGSHILHTRSTRFTPTHTPWFTLPPPLYLPLWLFAFGLRLFLFGFSTVVCPTRWSSPITYVQFDHWFTRLHTLPRCGYVVPVRLFDLWLVGRTGRCSVIWSTRICYSPRWLRLRFTRPRYCVVLVDLNGLVPVYHTHYFWTHARVAMPRRACRVSVNSAL